MAQPVKVSLPAAKVSKNQRAGVKQKQKIRLCGKGHAFETVRYVPLKGREKLLDVCACNRVWADATKPYQDPGPYATIKPDGVPGKARDSVKSKGATNAYLSTL
jgi:hypothetical protein